MCCTGCRVRTSAHAWLTRANDDNATATQKAFMGVPGCSFVLATGYPAARRQISAEVVRRGWHPLSGSHPSIARPAACLTRRAAVQRRADRRNQCWYATNPVWTLRRPVTIRPLATEIQVGPISCASLLIL